MISFREALSAPKLHFKRLGQTKPLYYDSKTIISSSNTIIETEIEWNDRHYMLYLPIVQERLEHIEQLESTAQERSRGPLIENIILYDELMLVDSRGNKHYYDIILQEKPKGKLLRDAVLHYKIADLRQAIKKMTSRLDAIGFNHKNLTPTNIIICDSGVARPLRYWYAEWEVFSDNDISQSVEYIREHYSRDIDSLRKPLITSREKSCSTPIARDGITRLCKGGRYGFIDYDGLQITPFVYSWASDFCEGRAIVARNGKMGVINNRGGKVIHQIYDTIEFDVESGIFTATRNQYRYLIDYEGKIIQRREKNAESSE